LSTIPDAPDPDFWIWDCRNSGAFRRPWTVFAHAALFLSLLLLPSATAWTAQAESPKPELPEAPEPQNPARPATSTTVPCPTENGVKPPVSTKSAADSQADAKPAPAACSLPQTINWYSRFINGPQVKPLTPKEKARLAMHNVLAPFNGLTILGEAGVAVGADARSALGPGMPGFGRYVGISFTQDLTREFFSTFLIPSITHQDPHYHRLPNASIPRRILHAITQVVWTQSDNGRGMVNYSDVVGAAADDEISNLYVPGRRTNLSSSAARFGTGLAAAPIDNFVSEFLPDVARRIHVRVILIQRIINHVAKTEGPGLP
jgi:hypothetical protein